MCKYCNRQAIFVEKAKRNVNSTTIFKGFYRFNNGESMAEGDYISLYFGVDENNRPCLWAAGDDYTDYYYPKYCPECGRKLEDIPSVK